MENKKTESQWVGITEITQMYLPVSKKKARKIVSLYLAPKMIGNKLFVDRAQLEALLNDPHRDRLPLDI